MGVGGGRLLERVGKIARTTAYVEHEGATGRVGVGRHVRGGIACERTVEVRRVRLLDEESPKQRDRSSQRRMPRRRGS